MNNKMMAAGLALVLVAMAMPTNAYHVTASGSDATNPHNWTARVGASFPVGDPLTNSGPLCPTIRTLYSLDATVDEIIDFLCIDDAAWDAGDGIIGFTLCEVPASTSIAGPIPGRAGFGGLCFMSYGCGGGNSDGTYNAYDGTGCKAVANPQPAIATVGRNWVSLTMQGPGATGNVGFLSEIDIFGCTTTTELVYDEQFAYTMNSGHVAGFPVQDVLPGQYGTYTATATTDPALTPLTHQPCGTAAPMYYKL